MRQNHEQLAKESLQYALAVKRLRAGKDVDAVLHGRSMWPMLKPGMLLKIQGNQEKYQPGDIALLVDSRGQGIVHRIIRFDKGRVITKGDGLPYLDPPWPQNNLIGKVVSVDGMSIQTVSWRIAGKGFALLSPLSRWPFAAYKRLEKIRNSLSC